MDNDVVLWCFEYFYHLDCSNSKIHCAPVKFSPITFRLCLYLLSNWDDDQDITQEMAIVQEHVGNYDLDLGR